MFLFVTTCLTSCVDENNCGITEQSDELFLQFYNIETKKIREVDFDSVGVAFANEEVFYLDSISNTLLYVPVDVNASTTNFTFFTDSVDYEFELSYRVNVFIENEACEPVFRILGLSASSVAFDSLSIKVLELNKLVSPHVEIYF